MANARSHPLDPTDIQSFVPNSWITVGGMAPKPQQLIDLHPNDSLPADTPPIHFTVQLDPGTAALLGVPLRVKAVNLPFILCTIPHFQNLDAPFRVASLDTRRLSLLGITPEYAKQFYAQIAEVHASRTALMAASESENADPATLAAISIFQDFPHTPAPSDFDMPPSPSDEPPPPNPGE